MERTSDGTGRVRVFHRMCAWSFKKLLSVSELKIDCKFKKWKRNQLSKEEEEKEKKDELGLIRLPQWWT